MKKTLVLAVAFTALTLGLALPTSARADAKSALKDAAKRGGEMFAHDTFGGHRKMAGAAVTCETCHLGGGQVAGRLPNGKEIPSLVNAAVIFPRYAPKMHRVVTLEDQIQHCVKGGLGGKPPAYGSTAMADMVSYLASIAHGQPMDAGGAPK